MVEFIYQYTFSAKRDRVFELEIVGINNLYLKISGEVSAWIDGVTVKPIAGRYDISANVQL